MKNNRALVFAGMGFELFALVLGALIIGPLIDQALGIKNLGTLLLLVMCIIGWMVHFVRLIQIYMKESNENPPDKN